MQRRAGLRKDRSGHRGDHASAMVAGIGRTACNAIVLALFLALLTESHAARCALLFQPLQAGVIVRELLGESLERVP